MEKPGIQSGVTGANVTQKSVAPEKPAHLQGINDSPGKLKIMKRGQSRKKGSETGPKHGLHRGDIGAGGWCHEGAATKLKTPVGHNSRAP